MTTDTTENTSTPGTDADGHGPDAVSFVRAHVDQLLDNPADPRGGERDEATLVELASSIRSVGLLQALTVVPVPTGPDRDPQRWVTYAGHRRRDAARLAASQVIAEALGHDIAADPTLADLDVDTDACGVDEVSAEVVAAAEQLRWLPCLVRPDLATAVGMELATALAENGIRAGLTTGQRARGAEQLSLAGGWSVTRIAAATGLSRDQARAAAALPRLGETAREATYRGEMSLEHAAVLDDLAGEGATDDELGRLARSGTMFEHAVSELRKTLRRRAAADALRDQAELRGWTVFDEPDGYPLDSTLAPLWSLQRADDPDDAPLLPRHGEDADPTASRVASPYAAMPDHGVLLHDYPWEEPHLEVVCADPETWGYRRDRHSTLYVAPEPAPDSAGGIADAGAAEPDAGDQPSTAGDGDHRPGHPDPAPRGDTPRVTPDDPCAEDVEQGEDGRDTDDSGAAGEDGAAEPDTAGEDTASEQARAAREAGDERRRVEAAEQEQQRRAEATQEAARLAAERAAENERLEAERAAERARRDALETAAETRWRHTAGLLRTQKGAAAHAELPATVMARFPRLLGEVEFDPAAAQVSALCAEPDHDPTTGAQRWSPGRITHRAVVTTAWVLHHNLTGATLTEPSMIEGFNDEAAVWWLDYLTARGYQPAEVETQVRDLLEQHVTHRLALEYGAGSSEREHAHRAQED